MTAIDQLTNGSSLRNSKNVKITPNVLRIFDDALDITIQKRKEMGIYVCGKEQKDNIVLTDGMLKSSNSPDEQKFTFDIENHPSLERTICDGYGNLMALAHTHPDGNSQPSRQDRYVSKNIHLMGCLVGLDDIKCFYGDKDYSVFTY